VAASGSCPVPFNTTRSVQFDVTAHTTGTLQWNVSASSGDVVSPSSGSVPVNGSATIGFADIVLDNAVTIEITNSTGSVVLSFTLQHY
jgi:hypothetical protein